MSNIVSLSAMAGNQRKGPEWLEMAFLERENARLTQENSVLMDIQNRYVEPAGYRETVLLAIAESYQREVSQLQTCLRELTERE